MKKTLDELNEYVRTIHEFNAKWWVDINTGFPIERNKKQLLMLMTSEVAEAMEGERKKDLMDDHLPHRKMAEVEMADVIIRLMDFCGGFQIIFLKGDAFYWSQELNYPVEIPEDKGEALFNLQKQIVQIDNYILNNHLCNTNALNWHLLEIIKYIEDYCDKYGYDLWGAVDEKNQYNLHRQDHKLENRKKEHGKVW